MHLIRRSVFRAASSPSSFLSNTRSLSTSTPFVLRSKAQSSISSSVFRRFNSDDAEHKNKNAPESADNESGSVRQAIDSATESASTYAGEVRESIEETGSYVKDAVADTAEGVATAFGARGRDDRRGGRDNGDRPRETPEEYRARREKLAAEGGDRGGYGGDRRDNNRGGYGRDRGGYGGDRYGGAPARGGRDGDRGPRSGGFTPADRAIVPTSSIYVGNLLFDVTAKDLEREFGDFGTVKNVIIAADNRGLSKGFGYVEFESVEQAAAAIEAKHQTVLEGRRLIVNYQAKSASRNEGRENEPSKTLFIGNLAFEMSDADLNKLFRDIRNVIDVRVAIDRRTGQPRGFAHADFVDVESAIKGKEALVGQEVYGRKLRIDFSAGSRENRTAEDAGAPRF